MTQKRDRRMRQTNRAGVRSGLIRAGFDPEVADRWCDLWEAEAARQGIASNGDYFWDAAKGWIDAQRMSTRPLR